MAITQISQIQVRRGLNESLPQLASGELGWSIDTQQLYVGNGTLAEGAPAIGLTEILTQYSNFVGSAISYVFQGSDAGITSQTGPTKAQPISRVLQKVLDENISVKDFGAVGDGIADDTAAINRAIVQVYPKNLNGVHRPVQRAIRFPGGVYKITGTLFVPPNVTFIGEGRNNTLILAAASTAITTCDSYLQIGFLLGTNGAILPSFITITDMAFQSPSSVPVISLASTSDMIFDRCAFAGGNYSVESVNNNMNAPAGPTLDISFVNTDFHGYAVGPHNFDTTVTGTIVKTCSYDTAQAALPSGTTAITSLANGAGSIAYQIQDNTNSYRFGVVKYNMSNGVCVFDEEYSEPIAPMSANLFINSGGVLSCTVANQSTLKYDLKQFI